MPSPFERLSALAFRSVSNVIGRDATWAPSNGGASHVGKVLFKEPTDEQRLLGIDFDPLQPECEFHKDTFPGLLAEARRTKAEQLVVGELTYLVMTVTALHDGQTHLAKLTKI